MSSWVRLTIGWCTLFVIGTDLFVVSPLLPLISAAFQLSPARAGLCVTSFAFAYMIAAPAFGALAERIGRRRTLIGCLLGFAAANLLTAWSPSFAWLVAARLLAGIGAAGVTPAIYAFIGDAAPPDRRGTWLGVGVSGLLISLSIGTPLGALVGTQAGWPSVFMVIAVLGIVLAGVNRFGWPRDHRAGGGSRPAVQMLGLGAILGRMSPMLVWSTALYGVYTYLGTGLTALGFSPEQIARLIAIYGGGAIVGTLLGGRLADRFGAKATAGASILGLGVCFFALWLAVPAEWPMAAVLGLASAVAQVFFPAQQAGLAADYPTRRASVLAWNNSALFLGISLGSVIGGAAIARGGFAGNMLLSAALAGAGFVVNWLAVPARRGAEPVID
jgi:predicted MFS family arabinose efflux permease